ncbi:MAG: hypothetical protein Q8N59_01175 [bacterium]|nr:hypothetical protein [bacterium]
MKLGGSFIRTRIGSVQGHRTETLGDVYVSKSKLEKFNHKKKEGKKKPLKKKKPSIKGVSPRTFRAFIQIVFNSSAVRYEVKVGRDKPSELRPCEKLIEQITHETIGKAPGSSLIDAKKIGEKRLKEILTKP